MIDFFYSAGIFVPVILGFSNFIDNNNILKNYIFKIFNISCHFLKSWSVVFVSSKEILSVDDLSEENWKGSLFKEKVFKFRSPSTLRLSRLEIVQNLILLASFSKLSLIVRLFFF